MECAFHNESFPEYDKLQTLSTLDSWHTILSAAKSRNYSPILERAESVPDGEFPSLKYHKRCRNKFVSDKYKERRAGSKSRKRARPRSSSRGIREISSGILPSKCIFCNGQKYIAKTNTRENLLSCCQIRADIKVRKSAELKNDTYMMAVTSDELIAKEAFYHASCYKAYTAIYYRKEKKEKKTKMKKHSIVRLNQLNNILMN